MEMARCSDEKGAHTESIGMGPEVMQIH